MPKRNPYTDPQPIAIPPELPEGVSTIIRCLARLEYSLDQSRSELEALHVAVQTQTELLRQLIELLREVKSDEPS
jgi:hypothetical protein